MNAKALGRILVALPEDSEVLFTFNNHCDYYNGKSEFVGKVLLCDESDILDVGGIDIDGESLNPNEHIKKAVFVYLVAGDVPSYESIEEKFNQLYKNKKSQSNGTE